MPYCTGKGLSRPRWRVRRSKSRCVALTSSSKWTGFPDRRVRTKTILITTSMLSSVCSTRPMRYVTMLHFLSLWTLTPRSHPLPWGRAPVKLGALCPRSGRERELTPMRHILPVVEPHMAGDQGPVANPRPYSHDGMRGANSHTGDVVMEPGDHLIAQDAHAFR